MTKIFTPLPGEYVASALQRGNELLGIKSLTHEEFNFRPIINNFSSAHMHGGYKLKAVTTFECPPFFTAHNISDEVLHNHTLYPIVKALGRTGRYAVATPIIWKKICIDCVFEDFLVYGTTFVRRRNILSCVSICSKHASELIEICPTCSIALKKHAISELNVCFLKYRVPTYQQNSRRHLLSKFVAELLRYSGPFIAPNRLHQHVIEKLSIKHKTQGSLRELINTEPSITDSLGSPAVGRVETVNGYVILAFVGFENVHNYLDWATQN